MLSQRWESLLDSRTGRQLPVLRRQPRFIHTGFGCRCIMERTTAVPTCRGPQLPLSNTSTSTLAFDQHFTTTAAGKLLLAEIVSGTFGFKTKSSVFMFERKEIKWKIKAKSFCKSYRHFDISKTCCESKAHEKQTKKKFCIQLQTA